MKMKKLIIWILNIVFVCLFLTSTMVTASAEESKSQAPQGAFSLTFALTDDNGKSVIMAKTNDVVKVSFRMKRTDLDEEYTVNVFQNYIHYDLTFFEFVQDSIVCYDSGMATAKKMTNLTYGEIILCQNMDERYEQEFVFCSFELKVLGLTGSGMVYNGEVYAFDKSYQPVTVTEQPLQVLIDFGCSHENKTKVNAKESTCKEKGWNTYYDCDDCDAFFDESGENLIAGIPYVAESHTFSNELTYNELGHWYACTKCSARLHYSSHNGGKATCIEKAVCNTCHQEYGKKDEHNHVGTIYLANYKPNWFWSDGYTGDLTCSACQGIIEAGEVISMFKFMNWPWWMIVICVIFFPIVLIGWLFIFVLSMIL